MKKNIFANSLQEKGIFKREEYLYPEFIPERLPHRDNEIDAIVFALRPLLEGKKPRNLFLFGPTGTGKTVTIRFVLKELHEYSDRGKPLYINCFEFNSRHSILTEIANFIGSAIPRRGLGTDEVYRQLINAMKKIDFIPIIVLDEIDQLLAEEQASKLLYDLLRSGQYQKNYFVVVLITNDYDFLLKLDERVKSSLMQESIEFKQYTPQQLKDILEERCAFAFNEDVIEKDAINLAAAFAAKNNGDARIAIECIFKAGKLAEKRNEKKVTPAIVREAFNSIYSRFVQKSLPALNEDEKILLSVLLKKDKTDSGTLYKSFLEKRKKYLSERSFRKKINHLVSMNLIKAETCAHRNKGMTRMISLNVDKKSIEELVVGEKSD